MPIYNWIRCLSAILSLLQKNNILELFPSLSSPFYRVDCPYWIQLDIWILVLWSTERTTRPIYTSKRTLTLTIFLFILSQKFLLRIFD